MVILACTCISSLNIAAYYCVVCDNVRQNTTGMHFFYNIPSFTKVFAITPCFNQGVVCSYSWSQILFRRHHVKYLLCFLWLPCMLFSCHYVLKKTYDLQCSWYFTCTIIPFLFVHHIIASGLVKP
jgi:hypothetical protein